MIEANIKEHYWSKKQNKTGCKLILNTCTLLLYWLRIGFLICRVFELYDVIWWYLQHMYD